MPVIFIILAVGMSLAVLGMILYVIIRFKKEGLPGNNPSDSGSGADVTSGSNSSDTDGFSFGGGESGGGGADGGWGDSGGGDSGGGDGGGGDGGSD